MLQRLHSNGIIAPFVKRKGRDVGAGFKPAPFAGYARASLRDTPENPVIPAQAGIQRRRDVGFPPLCGGNVRRTKGATPPSLQRKGARKSEANFAGDATTKL